MENLIKDTEYIENECKDENYNKIFICQILNTALIELKKISKTSKIDIENMKVNDIVNYIKTKI